jgi:outer membrane protein TolC
MSRSSIPAVALVLLLASSDAGCRSAAGWRAQADRDVYALVRDRRAKLGIGDGSLTIEPPKDSLRERLLRGEDAGTAPLKLVQCLEIAAENSRDYRSREEILYLAALDLTLERWAFGLQPTAVADAAVDGVGDTAQDATGGATLSLSKILGTGATLLGNIGLGLSRSLTTGDTWNPVGTVGLSITQPLLRGAGRQVALEPLTQSERNLVYAVRSFERYRRTFAFDVASRFYFLLETQDAVANQEKNFENLKKLSERNAALAEAGRLDDVQAGQARQDELRSLDNLLQARARLALQKDQFKVFLGLPPQVDLSFDAVELGRLAEQDLSPIDLDESRAAELALTTRLDHLNVLDEDQDSERHVAVAEDALRAGLSVGAAWTDSTAPGKPAKFDFRNSTWTLSAALDLPIDRLPERNAYRTALIAREVSRRSVEQSEDSIRAALRDDLRETKSTLESWRIQQNAVDLAARRIESTDLKLQAGRALTRDLLDAQEALLDARNSASSALVDYTLSRLALFRDLELLRVGAGGIEVDTPALPRSGNAGGGAASPEPGLQGAGT